MKRHVDMVLARLKRGQAMLEYSWIASSVLIMGTAATWGFWDVLMKALNLYFDSIYWVITSPVP